MTTVIKIGNTDGTYLDILGGTLQVKSASWAPASAGPSGTYKHDLFGSQFTFERYGTVTETMELVGVATAADIRTALTTLSQLAEQCRRWHSDPLEDNAVWLYWQADSESAARRALLYAITIQFASTPGLNPLLDKSGIHIRLTLTRHPLWEIEATSTLTQAGISTLGGKWVASTTATGTAPRRLQSTTIRYEYSAALARVWLGIRPPYEGNTSFVPLWELEEGVMGTDAAVATEAGVSPVGSVADNKVSVSFATVATNAERVSITPARVTGITDAEHMKGRYVVLCRCKVSSGTVALEMRVGYSGATAANLAPLAPVYISNTSYRLIELGEAQFPPAGWRTANGADVSVACAYTQLSIFAERISGSGTLSLDALVLIPATHYVKLEGASIWYDVGDSTPYDGYILTHENDITEVIGNVNADPSSTVAAVEHSAREWYFPMDGGIIVMAGEGDSAHVMDETVTLSLVAHTRWTNFS